MSAVWTAGNTKIVNPPALCTTIYCFWFLEKNTFDNLFQRTVTFIQKCTTTIIELEHTTLQQVILHRQTYKERAVNVIL